MARTATVRAIAVADKSGGARLEAPVWIEASGGADLAASCGVPTRSGRDSDGLTHAGIRETRRIVGRHVLTREEVVSGAHFEDAVALGGFPIDIHAPSGAGVDCPQGPGRTYQVPLHSLLTHEVPNLFVAGRCLSATFEAHASARITPTCMALGEAAGVVAATILHLSAPAHEAPVRDVHARLRALGAPSEPR